MMMIDANDQPEKVVGCPADGESDGDGAEQTGNTTPTSEHVGGPTTAYYAGSSLGPQLANNQDERADDERSRDDKQKREYSHAIRAMSPLPRPLLYAYKTSTHWKL